MSSPAERYAASRARARHPHLEAFTASLAFPLDEFQVEAAAHVEDGKGVLVAAPTGAGKTVVGEFAVYLALATGRKAFYTTPIKALSNQKYHDLAERHGAHNVGLLTGDSSINSEASVVITTTGASPLIVLSPVSRPTFAAPWVATRSLYFWFDRALIGVV